MRIPIHEKATLETQAAHAGLNYREHLIKLATKAAKNNFVIQDNTVSKTTRLEFNTTTKQKIKNLAKESGCSQEEWLLKVFKEAISNETQ